jgi:multidrug efflux system outer membrane protein
VGVLIVAGGAGCAVGPDYQRPDVNAPAAFRGRGPAPSEAGSTNTFADLHWWKVFGDSQLTSLITEALTNSWDVRIAAARVLEAEALLRIRRSEFFPTVNAGGDLVTSRASQKGPGAIPGVDPRVEYGDVFLSMPAYEVDLWGRIRRANEAARARLLATVDAESTVRQTLVSQVATAYLELLELDLEHEIAERAYAGRTISLELTRSREEGGVAGMQDVYQAQILVSTAQSSLVDISRRLEQQENLLSVLLGRNPGSIVRGSPLIAQTLRIEVPAGLPSSLLERRPDLRFAEQQLVAANADIGEAKAAFYPQVTLTGFFGYQSVALSDLFTGAARTWQFGPAVTMPLFTGGRLRGNLKAAQARFELSLALYRQAVQAAFREVSDALIAYERVREFRLRQEERTEAHRAATTLAADRYEGGVTSYLEVLYNEQELFAAELSLAQARRDELLTVVSLYRALGGGWQMDPGFTLTTNP